MINDMPLPRPRLRDRLQQGIYKVINPIVRGLIRLGFTPNVITITGMVLNIGVAAIFVLGAEEGNRGDLSYVGWAGALILFAGLFDMLDGQVARIGNMSSTFGALFDSVLDRYSELIMFLGVCYYLVAHHYFLSSLFAFIALIGSMMVSYTRARAEGLGIEAKGGLMQRPERVVLISLSAIACGIGGHVLGGDYKIFIPGIPFHIFETMTIFTLPIAVMAVMTNITAIGRLRDAKKALDAVDALQREAQPATKSTTKGVLLAIAMLASFGFPGAGAAAPGKVDTFPVPQQVEGLMFYVQRTPNTNTIIYALNYKSPGKLNADKPIHVYWIRYPEGGAVKELNYIQRNYAYGVQTRQLNANSWKLSFAAYKKRPFYLKLTTNGKYYVFTDINGHNSVLQRVYIQIDPGGSFWKPNVKYIELAGYDAASGAHNVEQIPV